LDGEGGALRSTTASTSTTSTPNSKVVEQLSTLTSPWTNWSWILLASADLHWAVCSRAKSPVDRNA
jgi:hypothetical protein